MSQEPQSYFLGIDVGTSSARVVLVDGAGRVISGSAHDITTFKDPTDHRTFEQSSGNIWESIRRATRDVLQSSQVQSSDVCGVGVCGTCSLVVVDETGEPVSVERSTLGQGGERNIVLWCDHRAEEQTRRINESAHPEMKVLGGSMDIELDIPKIKWLQDNMAPDAFAKCSFFCLPDYIAQRAAGLPFRPTGHATNGKPWYQLPTTHYSSPGGWSSDFLSTIGMGDFITGSIYEDVTPGTPLGGGLSQSAANELGLVPGTAIGAAVVDCYAGYFSTVATPFSSGREQEHNHDVCKCRIAAITGTSTCFVIQSPEPIFVKGVWGPLQNMLFPGWYTSTGGQNITGELLSHTVRTHPAHATVADAAMQKGVSVFDELSTHVQRLVRERGVRSAVELTKDLHVYPDFHGNRAPFADSDMRGMWSGLTLDTSVNDLALRYQATLEALALQFKHIFEEMNAAGHKIEAVFVSGGQAQNAPFTQLLANVCNVPVVLPPPDGSVAQGSAILGRFAYEMEVRKLRSDSVEEQRSLLWKCMTEMTREGSAVRPSESRLEAALLAAEYDVFRDMAEAQRRWRRQVREAVEIAEI